eukprot:m.656332 g.656332  ORF g.656332 m.656332 type:complete len:728 (-) comp58428_c0_seq1:94-2277(-)
MERGSNVKVVARVRPPNLAELNTQIVASTDRDGKTITIEGQRKAVFTFDRVFAMDSTQEDVYQYTARSIVEDVLKGYNGTIFAYGQTSSGKTFTMEGPTGQGPLRGIIPRIVEDIFAFIHMAPEFVQFTVKVSYIEIYMERIRDLLCDGNTNLQIHENKERGIYVRHATELFVQNAEAVMEVFRSGAERRAVAATNMNDYSSRSHSVFLLEIAQKDTVHGGSKSGKLHLVDLAGSEKVSRTGAEGEVLDEAKNINKSLSALGLVIMNLTDTTPQSHIPYRDSKLTRILQESLGGNARTTVVINASPSILNEAESLSSLRFGQRAKKMRNDAHVNVQFSPDEVKLQLEAVKKELQKANQKLAAAEQELLIWRAGGSVSEDQRAVLQRDADALAPIDPVPLTQSPPDAWEAEKEEWMRRETELLDMLDDKDLALQSLEKDVVALENEKISLTPLQVEVAGYQQKIRDFENSILELSEENSAYEHAIEMLDVNNKDLQREIDSLRVVLNRTVSAQEQEEKAKSQSQERAAHTANMSIKLIEEYRDRVLANIKLKREKVSESGDMAVSVRAPSQHSAYLERVNRDLTVAHQEAVKAHTSAQRELAVLQKQLAARNERIKMLETLMRQGEEEMRQQFEQHLSDMQRVQRNSSTGSNTSSPAPTRSTVARSKSLLLSSGPQHVREVCIPARSASTVSTVCAAVAVAVASVPTTTPAAHAHPVDTEEYSDVAFV